MSDQGGAGGVPEFVVIYRGFTPDEVCAATEHLLDAGFTAFEVTMNSPRPVEAVGRLAERFGARALIGSGTVRTVRQVDAVADAGARLVISPTTDPDVIAATKSRGLLSVPGAMTPTEIDRAWNAGADVVKLFPLGALGISYLRQVREPLGEIPLLVSGAVTAELARECFAAGCVSVGVGLGLFDADAATRRDWPALAAAAVRYRDTALG
ncbi:2-dehydro-3-deoxy-6-phosphogalactonate aldolase [Streptosporangium violaceochromogenes]|nr:2-dehydro-3-deoxy-6-phosphogalactonate aldolase [Streptosporangium violaceochromogenes]